MARVEILAGRERRRFWSDEQKRAVLEEASTSGSTMADVARRHDIVPQQIYTWRRQLGLSAPVATGPTFLPVVAASENGEPGCSERDTAPKTATRSGRPGRIEIRCTNGRVLKVEAGLDAGMLKALIRSVEDALSAPGRTSAFISPAASSTCARARRIGGLGSGEPAPEPGLGRGLRLSRSARRQDQAFVLGRARLLPVLQ